MATTHLTGADFESTVTDDGIVLVDLWAEWCGPCRAFAPTYDKVAADNPDITFAKVDTEAEQELAGRLGVMSIPTVMLFRDGVLLYNQPGALPEAALRDLVSQARALDMEQVKADLAAQSPAS